MSRIDTNAPKNFNNINIRHVHFVVCFFFQPKLPDPFFLKILPEINQDGCHVDQNSNLISLLKITIFWCFQEKKFLMNRSFSASCFTGKIKNFDIL